MNTPAAKEDDTPDAAWLALHEEREALDHALALAKARRRFAATPEESVEAEREEAALLLTLDRLLTRIRAEEYRRKPGARRW
ncbi:MAG: hypothetical protein INR70_25590 [Parafilimonas terrae]|nr:hypothetical protein [Parafilimonas terrae]